jgi:hypothetical protein
MKCFRCGKELGHADDKNSDYIIADDTKADEYRETFTNTEIQPGAVEKAQKDLAPDDLQTFKTLDAVEALKRPNRVKTEVTLELTTIQKTGIVCSDCHKDTDLIIWGIHKAL